jgi:hypothetical protein
MLYHAVLHDFSWSIGLACSGRPWNFFSARGVDAERGREDWERTHYQEG